MSGDHLYILFSIALPWTTVSFLVIDQAWVRNYKTMLFLKLLGWTQGYENPIPTQKRLDTGCQNVVLLNHLLWRNAEMMKEL